LTVLPGAGGLKMGNLSFNAWTERLRRPLLAMVVCCAMLAAVQAAQAEYIEFTFGGDLYQVIGSPPEPWAGIAVGDPFEVSYIFDSEAPDWIPSSPDEGLYYLETLTTTLNGVGQTTTVGEIRVTNAFIDEYYVFGFDLPIGAGMNVDLIGFDPFDSDALPLDLDLGLFELQRLFEVGGVGYEARGQITSFERRIVPAPSALIFLILGALPARRSRRKTLP
jgi:hypothetical protein